MALDKALDYEKIKEAAEDYRAEMVRFLRQMISRPSESCEEKEVVECIKAEMEKVGFDKVEIDGLGNVIGWIGDGDKILAIDSHVDTVGIGNIENWDHDPYEGYETDEIIYGRGGSDQEGGMASAVYAAKIMKDLDLIPGDIKSWSWAASRKRTATVCAGSTSTTRTRSFRSSSYPQNPPMAASTADTADVWRSVWT